MKAFGVDLIATALLLTAVAGQAELREGDLQAGINWKTFLAEWGRPDQTIHIVSGQQLTELWGIPGHLVYPVDRDEFFELWIYDGRATKLLFMNGDLVAWRVGTTDQLRLLPRGR
jgi:hypothetical protein